MTSILHVGITVEEIKRVNPASEVALYDSHPCLRKCFRACTNYLRFFLAFLASIETIIQRNGLWTTHGQLVHFLYPFSWSIVARMLLCFDESHLRGKARVTDSLRFINPLSFSSLARDRAVIYRRRSQIEKKYPANISAKNESLRLKIEFSSFDFSNSFIRSVKFKYVRVHSYIRS